VKAVREASARLLEAIEPLADALHPPTPPLDAPGVVCAPGSLDPEPYLRILRRLFKEGEALRVLGFPDQLDTLDPVSAIVGGAMEMFASAMDKAPAKTLVAVTDRRIITAKPRRSHTREARTAPHQRTAPNNRQSMPAAAKCGQQAGPHSASADGTPR
jgi:hypothetical protein